MTLLTLRTAGGIILSGASMEKAAELLTTVGHPYATAVTWDCVAGAALSVSADQLHAALRRFFSCEEVLCRAAGGLASLGFSRLVTESAQQRLTQAALLDTWPAAIVEASQLCAVAQSAHPAVATEQGLLWIIANALEDPWMVATEPLAAEAAQRRFARLAMIASGMRTIPTHLVPAVTVATERPDEERSDREEKKRFTTARTLLAVGRLVEYDDIVRWPVRTIELYGELLTEVNPSYAQVFEEAHGMSIQTWVIKVCSLAHLVWKKIADGELKFPVLDVSSPGSNADNPILRVIRALSTTRDSFATLMRACRTKAAEPTLAFQPIRQYPLLDLGDSRFVVLHKDFLLAAADDGIWYSLNDSTASRGQFGREFGAALERYVGRVLSRCASASDSSVARVPESGKVGVRRCDYAWRIGDLLVLIDSKRTGLSAAHLMGAEELDDRLEEELGGACKQFMATKRGFEEGALAGVLQDLGVADSWRPRAYLPIAVTHRPVFMHFSSAEVLLERMKMTAAWDREFSAWPTFWSIQDLEFLEAAMSAIDVAAFLEATLRRNPATSAGVPLYLSSVRYSGMCASAYYARRRDELIAPYLPSDPGP